MGPTPSGSTPCWTQPPSWAGRGRPTRRTKSSKSLTLHSVLPWGAFSESLVEQLPMLNERETIISNPLSPQIPQWLLSDPFGKRSPECAVSLSSRIREKAYNPPKCTFSHLGGAVIQTNINYSEGMPVFHEFSVNVWPVAMVYPLNCKRSKRLLKGTSSWPVVRENWAGQWIWVCLCSSWEEDWCFLSLDMTLSRFITKVLSLNLNIVFEICTYLNTWAEKSF